MYLHQLKTNKTNQNKVKATQQPLVLELNALFAASLSPVKIMARPKPIPQVRMME